MKLHFKALAACLALLLIFTGCAGNGPAPEETTAKEETTSAPEETTASETTLRDPDETPLISSDADKRGDIKVLFVGNSYSVNVSNDLYDLLKEAGYDKVDVAVLYYSGCSLEMHCDFFRKDDPVYRLYYNGKGNWTITPDYTEPANYRMDQVLKMTKWDHIIFNTGSVVSGDYSSVDPYLEILENHIRQYQPDAHFSWMVNWTWQEGEGSTEEILGRLEKLYGGSQQKQFEANRAMSMELMKNHPEIEFMIPELVVIQNMRTSRFGDEGTWIVRDGTHLSYDYGYYIGALAVAKSIADIDIEASTWIPEEYKDKFEDPELVAGLKAAVQDAFNDPWNVTQNPWQ